LKHSGGKNIAECYFEDSFEVTFLADTVLQIPARPEGYADRSLQIKPHYERNVQLEMKVEVFRPTPTPGGVQG
jgi:hypothetical protein